MALALVTGLWIDHVQSFSTEFRDDGQYLINDRDTDTLPENWSRILTGSIKYVIVLSGWCFSGKTGNERNIYSEFPDQKNTGYWTLPYFNRMSIPYYTQFCLLSVSTVSWGISCRYHGNSPEQPHQNLGRDWRQVPCICVMYLLEWGLRGEEGRDDGEGLEVLVQLLVLLPLFIIMNRWRESY